MLDNTAINCFSLCFKVALETQLTIYFFGKNTLIGNQLKKEIDHFTRKFVIIQRKQLRGNLLGAIINS